MKKILIIFIISSLGLICNAKNYTTEFIIEDSCSITTIKLQYDIDKKWVHDTYDNRIFVKDTIEYTIMEELENYNLIEYWTASDFYKFMDNINEQIKSKFKNYYPNPKFKLLFGNYKSTNKCIK
jgi:hypothetical protein